jgi:immune inhibitor InhA-like protein
MIRRAALALGLGTSICLAPLLLAGLAEAAEPGPPVPRTGERLAASGADDLSYKRLTRVVSVPTDGARLSFWVSRDTEPGWDFTFVEAHTADAGDWTTLPDMNGHTSDDPGLSCPFWHEFHPFLQRYQSDLGDETCAPTGWTGQWWAASGLSDGWEQWVVDLSRYAGRDVAVSISYVSDDVVQKAGVLVDDVVVSTGAGSTSFEDDGDTLDGWTVPGAPRRSAPNPNDWTVGAAPFAYSSTPS